MSDSLPADTKDEERTVKYNAKILKQRKNDVRLLNPQNNPCSEVMYCPVNYRSYKQC